MSETAVPPPSDGFATRLSAYAEAIRSSPHNLVSKRAASELEERHLPECVALAERLPVGPRELLDVGSGGGLPGLVIALRRPDLTVHMIESTAKKATFLRETAQELGVVVEVHNDRMEALHQSPLAGRFEIVTARAVAPLVRLIPWTAPFLAPTGVLYAVKGARWPEELEEAAAALVATKTRVLAVPDEAALTGQTGPEALRLVQIARQ